LQGCLLASANGCPLRHRKGPKLGAALYETGNLGEAQRQLEQARTQRGDKASEGPILQLYLGQVYARTGEFKQSIAAFNLYLAALPNSANAPAVKPAIARMQSELAVWG
jgi:tetratricopeptide (TPR) repeat protein